MSAVVRHVGSRRTGSSEWRRSPRSSAHLRRQHLQATSSRLPILTYAAPSGSLFSSLLVPVLLQHIDAGDRKAPGAQHQLSWLRALADSGR
jgi:hypothetical protein